MLKESIVKNTWACDNCDAEVSEINNPFYTISVLISESNTQIDLCQNCAQLINIPSILDWIRSLNPFP